MKPWSLTVLGPALALVLPALARADAMPPGSVPDTISIDENWAPSGSGFVAGTSNDPVGGASFNGVKIFPTGYTGSQTDHYLFLTNEPLGTLTIPPDSTTHNIVAAQLWTVSSAGARTPDHIDTNYTLSLVLTDDASNSTKPLTFYGHLSGDFSHGADSITNVFYAGPGSTTPVSNVSQTVTLKGPDGGSEDVTVQLTVPGAPNSNPKGNPGSIGGLISATFSTASGSGGGPGPGSGGGPGPSPNPEPSTLVLSFLGLSGLGAASWRRWRAGRA